MTSIEGSESVLVLRQTQDTFDLTPPVKVHLDLGKDRSVKIGRVHIAWEVDPVNPESADVTVVAWNFKFNREPYISHSYPVLLDTFAPLIEQTRERLARGL